MAKITVTGSDFANIVMCFLLDKIQHPEEVVEFEASPESIPDEVYTPEVVKPDFDFDLSLDDDEEDAPVGDFFL